jgi:murein L,D-transpeptidase YafK
MERMGRSISITVRFVAAMLLVAVLSPVRDAPGTANSAFLTLLSSLDGELSLVIWKSHYTVTLYKGQTPVKTYAAVFGRGYAEGDKERSGDKRTPEGVFYICSKNNSARFYKFLGLSYPSLRHAGQGLRKGLITETDYAAIAQALQERRQPNWETRLGGAVGIHGRMIEDPVGHAARQNWTDGCIALPNADMDELFSLAVVGMQVRIAP